MRQPVKIAYATTYDASDITQWSGTGYYVAKSLREQGILLEQTGPLDEKFRLRTKAKSLLCSILYQKRFLRQRDPAVLRSYAQQTAARLATISVDAVFSPGTIPIAFLRCREPIVFWSDATFAGMIDFYPAFTKLHSSSIRHGMAMEQSALDRAVLAIYSSDWAARSAVENYGVDPEKVKVVPYGANIECDRTAEDIEKMVDLRARKCCRLLFPAVDWIRKGGNLVVEIATALNARGLPTELIIMGCQPPRELVLPNFVRCLGFVSKSTRDGQDLIRSLFQDSHFLVLPSMADCTPVVFNEASSFGLPSITTNVGGIPSVIRDDLNGKTFARTADPNTYANYIKSTFADFNRYRQLALSSFKEYQTRLNWHVAGAAVKKLLTETLDRPVQR